MRLPRRPNPRRSSPPGRRWLRFARFAWVALVLVHVPVLVRALTAVVADGATPERLASVAAIAATIVIFLLKSLWQHGGRRQRWSLIALCLVASLVHHEVIAPVVRRETVATVTTVAVSSLLSWRVWRRRSDLHRWLLDVGRTFTCAPALIIVAARAHRHGDSILLSCAHRARPGAPRAPPPARA